MRPCFPPIAGAYGRPKCKKSTFLHLSSRITEKSYQPTCYLTLYRSHRSYALNKILFITRSNSKSDLIDYSNISEVSEAERNSLISSILPNDMCKQVISNSPPKLRISIIGSGSPITTLCYPFMVI